MHVERKLPPESKNRLAVLMVGWVAMVAAVGAVLMTDGPIQPDTLVVVAILLGLVTLLIAAAAVAIIRGWALRPMPAGYEKRPVERLQWSRSYASLVLFPLMMTNFAIVAASGVHSWMREGGGLFHLTMLAFLPFLAILFVSALSPFPRGKPGSRERRVYERMNDELSVAHLGVAFRYGFFAALLGMTGVTATALFAPKGVLLALIAAFWLASVTTLVRFGLLQRGAEPRSDED